MRKQIVIDQNLISYVEIQGQGNGPVLLFLHGWRSNKEVWQGIIKKFISLSADQHISLLALDLPGFGGSQGPKQPMAVGDYAEVVAEFIKNLELRNVILIGHSFGGRVGIKLAANYSSFIEKLVLVDSAGFAMPSSKKNLYRTAAKIVKPIFKPAFMQGLRKKIYQSIGAEDYVATPELQKTFVNVVSEDLSEDMGRVFCPTLIIFGENDEVTPKGFGQRMQLKIKNSKLKILPNAGHYSFLDQPEEFVEILSEFVVS